MPKSEESSHRALERLDQRLEAFEAGRAVKPKAFGIGETSSDGYRVLGEMLGGVLGGTGLGWLVDRFAHTSPWGLIGGLLIGTGLSIYAVVLTASRMSANAAKTLKPAASAPKTDDDDD
jgi:ATP synthase protein I